MDDLRQEFTFKPELRTHAQSVLRETTMLHNLTEPVYVSVHVRRTDYIDYLWQKLKARPAPANYYFNAMKYFEKKYKNVVFLIASDNILWCKHNLQRYNWKIKFISNTDLRGPGYDLAVLAACNHSIIDYGTYGCFGAIMAGGETIVYNVTAHFSTLIAEAMPNWKVMN